MISLLRGIGRLDCPGKVASTDWRVRRRSMGRGLALIPSPTAPGARRIRCSARSSCAGSGRHGRGRAGRKPGGSRQPRQCWPRETWGRTFHPVNATALPGGFENPGDSGLEGRGRGGAHTVQRAVLPPRAVHQPDPANQGTQELDPEGLGLQRSDSKTDDLAGCWRRRRSGRDRHDAAALAHLEGGVQPEIGHSGGSGARQASRLRHRS